MSPDLTVGSLCTGYAGLEMGLRDAVVPWTPIRWVADPAPGPARLLAGRFPDTRNYGDITEVDWSRVEPVDVITAGTPCQGFSLAGHRRGLLDARSAVIRHMLRAVRKLRPRLVVWENVASAPAAWVAGELDSAGYRTATRIVTAAEAGAPHRRRRVFVLAARRDVSTYGLGRTLMPVLPYDGPRAGLLPTPTASMHTGPGRGRRQGGPNLQTAIREGLWMLSDARRRQHIWERRIGRLMPDPEDDQGRLSMRYAEWLMGTPDRWVTGIDGLTRTQQAQLIGNGVVPQQATYAIHALARDLAKDAP